MGNIIWFLLNVKSDQQEDCKSQRHILEQVFGLFQMFSQVKREARASSKLSTYQFHTKKSCLSLSSWKIRHRRQEEEPSNELYQQLKKHRVTAIQDSIKMLPSHSKSSRNEHLAGGGSVIMSSCCFCTEPEFGCQHLQWVSSQPPISPVART